MRAEQPKRNGQEVKNLNTDVSNYLIELMMALVKCACAIFL